MTLLSYIHVYQYIYIRFTSTYINKHQPSIYGLAQVAREEWLFMTVDRLYTHTHQHKYSVYIYILYTPIIHTHIHIIYINIYRTCIQGMSIYAECVLNTNAPKCDCKHFPKKSPKRGVAHSHMLTYHSTSFDTSNPLVLSLGRETFDGWASKARKFGDAESLLRFRHVIIYVDVSQSGPQHQAKFLTNKETFSGDLWFLYLCLAAPPTAPQFW